VADRVGEVIAGLANMPAVIGHSFGGLLAQILAGRGMVSAAVAIDPAPFRACCPCLNPWTEAKVDTGNPSRGPLLIISGEKDHTVPWAIASASYKHQSHNSGVTEIVEMAGRGHALTLDNGWREVAETALKFVQRFTRP
jgi:pimeloyl-ACP methyl ester carboxylesterase